MHGCHGNFDGTFFYLVQPNSGSLTGSKGQNERDYRGYRFVNLVASFRPHFCSNSGNDSTSLAQLQSRLLSIKNAPLLTFPPRQVNTSRQNGSVRRVTRTFNRASSSAAQHGGWNGSNGPTRKDAGRCGPDGRGAAYRWTAMRRVASRAIGGREESGYTRATRDAARRHDDAVFEENLSLGTRTKY